MEENFRILKPYFRGLPLIIGAMVVAYMIADKYLSYVTPMYESTTKLRLADIGEGVPNSNLFKDLDVFVSSNKIASEIEVLKSQVLLEKVLNELNFDLEIYRVGKIRSVELYDQSPLLIHVVALDEDYHDKLFDVQVSGREQYVINTPGQEVIHGKMGDTLRIQATTLVIQLNESLLTQSPHLQIADHYQFRVLSRQKLLGKIQQNLDIMEVDKDVAVIRINYKSPNPQKASILANKLAEAYIQDYIETKYKAAHVTVSFLEDQIKAVHEKLSEAENKIQTFRDQKGITNIFQETETDLRKISQLKIQQTNLKMSLEAIQELETYVKAEENNFLNLAPNFEAFTDLLSTEIVKKIKELQAEKKDLLLIYTPQDDRVKVVDRKIEDLTSYLIESITNTRKNLEVKYKKLSDDIEKAEQAFITVPEKEKMLTILNREFQIYQQSYNFLNEKKIEAEIAQAAKIAFHRIITPAKISKEPVSPNYTIIRIVSALLGMFSAIAFIFIVHMLKAKVNDKETIESSSLIPIAALTPRLANAQAIEQHFQKKAAQLEIKGLIADESKICLSYFSVESGGIFNALHLAQALARQERSTLMIDVANSLNYTYSNIGEVIKVEDNLHVASLDNPAYTRFSQDKLRYTLEQMSAPYALTIILNDKLGSQMSLLMMALSTVNLVVLDSRITPAKRIMEVDLMKEEYNFPNMHFILNRFGYNPSLLKETILCVYKMEKRIKAKMSRVNA